MRQAGLKQLTRKALEGLTLPELRVVYLRAYGAIPARTITRERLIGSLLTVNDVDEP